jgi:hypothetical protein
MLTGSIAGAQPDHFFGVDECCPDAETIEGERVRLKSTAKTPRVVRRWRATSDGAVAKLRSNIGAVENDGRREGSDEESSEGRAIARA